MITPEDREKYKYHTDSSILGIKLVGGLSNEILLAHKNGDKEIVKILIKLMGKDTNPNWIDARLADEMLDRDIIDEDEHYIMTK